MSQSIEQAELESLANGASPMTSLTAKLVKESQPKFDTIIDISFQYVDGGRWYSIDVSFNEYLQILRSGEVDDRQISAIEVSVTDTENEEGDKIKMVYDFMLLNTGKNPWRMI